MSRLADVAYGPGRAAGAVRIRRRADHQKTWQPVDATRDGGKDALYVLAASSRWSAARDHAPDSIS